MRGRGIWGEPELAVLVTGLLLLVGCQTVPPLPPVNLSEAGWTVQRGQAAWNPARGETEIVGELLVAMHADGRQFVEFAKPPVPIVTAQTLHNTWQIHFSPRNKTYSGHGAPPTRIVWLQLPDFLKGKPARDSWEWHPLENGSWHLENKSTGEFLEGYLKP